MAGAKRYDLRWKDMVWHLRDSLAGASLTDTKDVAFMKQRMARNLFIAVGVIVAGALVLWLTR